MIAKNKKFTSTKIMLDGGTFENCTFKNCEIVYSGYLSVVLQDCTFDGCNFSFDGPAGATLQFMKGIYGAGAQEIIENTFAENGSYVSHFIRFRMQGTGSGGPEAGGPTRCSTHARADGTKKNLDRGSFSRRCPRARGRNAQVVGKFSAENITPTLYDKSLNAFNECSSHPRPLDNPPRPGARSLDLSGPAGGDQHPTSPSTNRPSGRADCACIPK